MCRSMAAHGAGECMPRTPRIGPEHAAEYLRIITLMTLP